jgi:hypothetical protein
MMYAAVWSTVGITFRSAPEARRVRRILRDAGYEILGKRGLSFYARRRLRSVLELDAEMRRLLVLAKDRTALHVFPPRSPRRPGLPDPGPFRTAVFDRLRFVHRWHLTWVGAERRAPLRFVDARSWTVGAWCLCVDDEEEIDLGVQLFSKRARVDPRELRKLTAAMERRLRPVNYHRHEFLAPRPDFALFTCPRSIRTLSAARRERTRLDRLLFGD